MNKHAGAMAACLALQPVLADDRFTHSVLAAGSIVVIN